MRWWENLERTVRSLLRIPPRVHLASLESWRAALEGPRSPSLAPGGQVVRVASAPDASSLALGLAAGEVRILGLDGAVEPRRFAGLGGGVAGLAYVPRDPTLLVAAAGDGEVRLLTTELSSRLWAVRLASAGVVAMAPGGRRAAVGGRDGRIRFLELAGGRVEAEVEASDRGLVELAFEPGGEGLAALDEAGRVVLLRDGARVGRVEAHEGRGRGLAWAEDGSLVYSLGTDGILAVSRVEPAARLAGFRLAAGGPAALAMVPGGELLLVGYEDGALELRDSRDGRARARIEAGKTPVGAVAMAPDGLGLAVGAGEGWRIGLPAAATRA